MLSHRRLLVVAYLLFLAPRTTEAFFIRFLLCLLFPKANFCPKPIPPPTSRPIRPPPTPPPSRRPIAPSAPTARPATPRPIAPTAPTVPPPTPRPVVVGPPSPPNPPPVVGPPNAGPPNAPKAGPPTKYPTTAVALPQFSFVDDLDKKFLPLPSAGSPGRFSACILAANRRFNTELALHRGRLNSDTTTTIDSVSPTTIYMSAANAKINPGLNIATLDSTGEPGDSVNFADLLWFGNNSFSVQVSNRVVFNNLPNVTVTVGLLDDNEVEATLVTGSDGVTPQFLNLPVYQLFYFTFFRANGFWGGSAIRRIGSPSPPDQPRLFYVTQPSDGSNVDNNDFSLGSTAGWTHSTGFPTIELHREDLNTTKSRALRRSLTPNFDLRYCIKSDDLYGFDSEGSLSRAINTPVGAKTFTVRYRYASNTGGSLEGGFNIGPSIDGYQIMYRGKGETAVGSEGNSWYGLHRAGDPMNDKDTDSLLYTSQWRTFTRPTSPGATTVQLDIVLYMKFNPPLNKKACIIVDYMIAE